MPCTKKDYPPAMKNLSVKVRNKAIEIPNAILEDGKLDEGASIAMGISKAKDVTADRNKEKADSRK